MLSLPNGWVKKNYAHRIGMLHAAFSVMLYHREPMMQWLLQQRSASKYHSANLWSNTCCGHPMPNEAVQNAAYRRLHEELGIQKVSLTLLNTVTYYLPLQNNGIEHEHCSIFIGAYEGIITPNPTEMQSTVWQSLEDITQTMNVLNAHFTPWFLQILPFIQCFCSSQTIDPMVI
jgi:isopentenyl-diphosphate Delta-isomerase